MTQAAQDAGQDSHTWRITAYLYAPMMSINSAPNEEGQTLTFASRLVPKVISYQGMTIALLPSTARDQVGQPLPLGIEQAFLVADINGAIDALRGTEAAVDAFEILIDSLSFQLGGVIRLGQFEVIDTTTPVEIGDERELRIFSGPPYGTNIRSVEMESIRGSVSVTLPDQVPAYDAPTAAVLRWFTKSMSTDLLHDAFIFLWIALEVLVDQSLISIEAPYQARCNHAIKHCPECGASTAREVRGATIRRYLEVSHGVNGQTAGALWRMRQMMHGAINFDTAKLRDLPTLIQPLRAAVAEGLKRRIGTDTHAAPVIMSSGTAINPAMGMGGSRQINVEDLQSLQHRVDGNVQPDSDSSASEDLGEQPMDSTTNDDD